MNFLSVGFVLCAMNFNLGWEMNYGVRLAGALFMLAGLAEADSVSEGFKAFRGRVMGIAGISAGGLAVTLLLRFGVIPEKLRHPLGIVFGVSLAACVIWVEYRLLKHIVARHELVNDPSLLGALQKKWTRYAFFAGLSVFTEALYRILPLSDLQAGVGAVEIISRIIMYVYVILVSLAFARVRNDFNVMHPV